jgi:DNA-binding IclR family transcriptional regulator
LRGDHLPAHCVAAGKAILAHADAATVDAFLARSLPRLTPTTITDRAAFLRDLRATKQRGYGLNVGEWMEDVTGVSAPVFTHSGTVQGAIGVAGPISRLNARNMHRIGRLVRRYADRVSHKLGGLRAA